MGIKYIHATLIVISILLSLGFGAWAMMHSAYALWGYASFLAAAGLTVYGVQFIKQMKVL